MVVVAVGGLWVVVVRGMHMGCIGRLTATFANWNVRAGIVNVVVDGVGRRCRSNVVGLGVGKGGPIFDLLDLRPQYDLHYGWGSDKHNTEFQQHGHGS